jgi:hypothetical protein
MALRRRAPWSCLSDSRTGRKFSPSAGVPLAVARPSRPRLRGRAPGLTRRLLLSASLRSCRQKDLGREERYRTDISGMEPRRIAVVMLLPRLSVETTPHQTIAMGFRCQPRQSGVLVERTPPASVPRSKALRFCRRSRRRRRCTGSGVYSSTGGFYRARANTRVTSSGCSLSPIQSSTARVTI